MLWPPGMLVQDASLQVSFLKDLATFRHPRSKFTFINFLKQSVRLGDCINRGTAEPLRIEFTAYLRSAAASGVVGFELEAAGRTVRVRNGVVAAGLQPSDPEGVNAGERV